MPPDEGEALYEAGLEGGRVGPLLEIGSYCGRSAIYLGAAARERDTVLYSIDHHRGSEEIQPGWEHHDAELVDPRTGRMDSLPFFRRTISEAGLEDIVVGVVGDSPTIARHWTTPLGLVFIDGAHSEEHVLADYNGWAPKVAAGGLLVFHDVFEDPEQGGQGPYRAWQAALGSARFCEEAVVGSLRVGRLTANSPSP